MLSWDVASRDSAGRSKITLKESLLGALLCAAGTTLPSAHLGAPAVTEALLVLGEPSRLCCWNQRAQGVGVWWTELACECSQPEP